jgi:hypothetical protein
MKMAKYILPKELPEIIREKIGNTFVHSAKQMDDGTYVVETAMKGVSVDFRKIRVFDENGDEKIVIRDIKLEAEIDGERLSLVDSNPKLLLMRLVKALEG